MHKASTHKILIHCKTLGPHMNNVGEVKLEDPRQREKRPTDPTYNQMRRVYRGAVLTLQQVSSRSDTLLTVDSEHILSMGLISISPSSIRSRVDLPRTMVPLIERYCYQT